MSDDEFKVVARDPHELGWRRDIIGQSGDPSGRTWIKPDGTYYIFAPGVEMVLFEAPSLSARLTAAGVKP